MLQKFKTLIVLFISTITLVLAQEKGKIAGKIEDSGTSEELIGVAIGIKGSSQGSVTDIEGHYILSLEPGTYTLVVNYMGYKTKEISDVLVTSGQTTDLKITLEEATVETEEVVVIATFKKESVDALMLERKNSVAVSDGISADLIKKTPDRNAADVLKRITGATIQDNKFAIIRGLNERYNTAFINNAPLPSSEPDRKAFALDIFPSNIVESMNIFKTATPDLPGDFAGGVIKIKTRDIPDETFYSLSIGANTNNISTFKPGLTYKGGKTDWLGIDDGTRKLPNDFPTKDQLEPNYDGIATEADKNDRLNEANIAAKNGVQSMSNNWEFQKVNKLSPGTNFQFTTGQKIKNFGMIVSLSHTRSIRHVDYQLKDYDLVGKQLADFKDEIYNENVLWGGIANLSYKIHENHKISLKNTYNINSQDQLTYRTGNDLGNGSNNSVRTNSTIFTQNRMNSHQLSGEHFFATTKLKADWVVGISDIRRLQPDYKILSYTKDINADDSQYRFASGTTDPRVGGRFFSKMDETVKSGGFDLSRNLPTVSIVKTEIKVGAYLQQRERSFAARQFVIERHQGFDKLYNAAQTDSIERLGADQIFSSQNFDYQYNKPDPSLKSQTDDEGNVFFVDANGNKVNPKETWLGTFTLDERTGKSDVYKASSNLNAFYFMLDHRFATLVRVTWGARYESYNQKLSSFVESQNRNININDTKGDWLPSVNLTVSPLKKMNIRAAYYKTLNRPEFRELAPFRFFDFATKRIVEGNDSLQRCKINNYDLRLEFFPGAGQVLSVTGFYKQFDSPIERYLPPEGQFIVYANAKSAQVQGLEFEFRQNLQIFSPSNKYLNRITLSGNYSRIGSSTQSTDKYLKYTENNRPLQGQSNYIINTALTYDNEDKGFAVNFVVNRVGRRLFLIGNTNEPNIWENPRTILDLQITKLFFKKKLEAKINFSDLLAQNQVFYQDINDNKKYDADQDYTIFKWQYGTTTSYSLTYKF